MPEHTEGAATTAPTKEIGDSVPAHPLAGKTVRLPGGAVFAVEDWWARVNPTDTNPFATANPAHLAYIVRRVERGLRPVPGVYGHIGSLGHILAPDELEGAEVVG
jgi:hypothetical protein